MANYTNEISKMMSRIGIHIAVQDQAGFFTKALGTQINLMQLIVLKLVKLKNMRIQDVVTETNVNRNIVNTTISNLIKQGFLYKKIDEDDARCQILGITEKGESLVIKLENEQKSELEFMLGGITVNEELAILKFLSKYSQYHTGKFNKSDENKNYR